MILSGFLLCQDLLFVKLFYLLIDWWLVVALLSKRQGALVVVLLWNLTFNSHRWTFLVNRRCGLRYCLLRFLTLGSGITFNLRGYIFWCFGLRVWVNNDLWSVFFLFWLSIYGITWWSGNWLGVHYLLRKIFLDPFLIKLGINFIVSTLNFVHN